MLDRKGRLQRQLQWCSLSYLFWVPPPKNLICCLMPHVWPSQVSPLDSSLQAKLPAAAFETFIEIQQETFLLASLHSPSFDL
jgi:hypothetical protein